MPLAADIESQMIDSNTAPIYCRLVSFAPGHFTYVVPR